MTLEEAIGLLNSWATNVAAVGGWPKTMHPADRAGVESGIVLLNHCAELEAELAKVQAENERLRAASPLGSGPEEGK